MLSYTHTNPHKQKNGNAMDSSTKAAAATTTSTHGIHTTTMGGKRKEGVGVGLRKTKGSFYMQKGTEP